MEFAKIQRTKRDGSEGGSGRGVRVVRKKERSRDASGEKSIQHTVGLRERKSAKGEEGKACPDSILPELAAGSSASECQRS